MARTKIAPSLTNKNPNLPIVQPIVSKSAILSISVNPLTPIPIASKIKKKCPSQSKRTKLLINHYKNFIDNFHRDDFKGFIPFARLIRSILSELFPNTRYRIQTRALLALKVGMIDFALKIFQNLSIFATACNRITVKREDLRYLALVLKAWNSLDAPFFTKVVMPSRPLSTYQALGQVRRIVKESFGQQGDAGRATVFIEKEKVSSKEKKNN